MLFSSTDTCLLPAFYQQSGSRFFFMPVLPEDDAYVSSAAHAAADHATASSLAFAAFAAKQISPPPPFRLSSPRCRLPEQVRRASPAELRQPRDDDVRAERTERRVSALRDAIESFSPTRHISERSFRAPHCSPRDAPGIVENACAARRQPRRLISSQLMRAMRLLRQQPAAAAPIIQPRTQAIHSARLPYTTP